MTKAIKTMITNNFFMALCFLIVIVSFLRFALQKYSISQNEIQLVKPLSGLVYHVAKIQKNKRLDFNLLQNQNPTVVYGVVYVVMGLLRKKSY